MNGLATTTLALLVLAASCRAPGSGSDGDTFTGADTVGRISATSSYGRTDSAGHPQFHITNRRFLSTRLYRRGVGPTRPLVKETVDQDCCLNGERDSRATITLEGWGTLDSPRSEPGWTVRFEADEGDIWYHFYRGTLYGCCDQTDALTFVSLYTGTAAFVASRESSEHGDVLLSLRVPNSGLERFFAFHDRYTPRDPREAVSDTSVVGVLQYGSGDEPPARLIVRWLGGRGLLYRLGTLALIVDGKRQHHQREIDLWSADGKEEPSALSGFTMVLTLEGIDYPESVISVPVVADSPRVDLATVPAGWTLRRSE